MPIILVCKTEDLLPQAAEKKAKLLPDSVINKLNSIKNRDSHRESLGAYLTLEALYREIFGTDLPKITFNKHGRPSFTSASPQGFTYNKEIKTFDGWHKILADSEHSTLTDSENKILADSEHQTLADSEHPIFADSEHQTFADSEHQTLADSELPSFNISHSCGICAVAMSLPNEKNASLGVDIECYREISKMSKIEKKLPTDEELCAAKRIEGVILCLAHLLPDGELKFEDEYTTDFVKLPCSIFSSPHSPKAKSAAFATHSESFDKITTSKSTENNEIDKTTAEIAVEQNKKSAVHPTLTDDFTRENRFKTNTETAVEQNKKSAVHLALTDEFACENKCEISTETVVESEKILPQHKDDEAAKKREFFRKWTALEAALKADGGGFSAFSRVENIIKKCKITSFNLTFSDKIFSISLAAKK